MFISFSMLILMHSNVINHIRAVPENVLRGVGGNDFSVRYPVVKN